MKAIIKLTKRITLEIQDVNEMETLVKAIALTQQPKFCTKCKNEKGLYLTSNKDKDGNLYVNLKCPECQAKVKLGVLKSGGYFWHREFEVYQRPKNDGEAI